MSIRQDLRPLDPRDDAILLVLPFVCCRAGFLWHATRRRSAEELGQHLDSARSASDLSPTETARLIDQADHVSVRTLSLIPRLIDIYVLTSPSQLKAMDSRVLFWIARYQKKSTTENRAAMLNAIREYFAYWERRDRLSISQVRRPLHAMILKLLVNEPPKVVGATIELLLSDPRLFEVDDSSVNESLDRLKVGNAEQRRLLWNSLLGLREKTLPRIQRTGPWDADAGKAATALARLWLASSKDLQGDVASLRNLALRWREQMPEDPGATVKELSAASRMYFEAHGSELPFLDELVSGARTPAPTDPDLPTEEQFGAAFYHEQNLAMLKALEAVVADHESAPE